jgi:hypothetical protein
VAGCLNLLESLSLLFVVVGHDVYEKKQHQFKTIHQYAHWHNEVKPHLSLNIETETPIQAFHRKRPPKEERTETAEPLVKQLWEIMDRTGGRNAYYFSGW